MTFSHPMVRTAGQPPSLDLTAHPTVGAVCPGSPAERGGLLAGDTVLELNGLDFRDRAARDQMRGPPGTELRYRVRRGRAEHELTVVVPERGSPASRGTEP
jgi:C-terminal processing protease CtpA/Prc